MHGAEDLFGGEVTKLDQFKARASMGMRGYVDDVCPDFLCAECADVIPAENAEKCWL